MWTPPIRRMLDAGIPVGAGTDATRVASYNPWVCLGWLVTGKSFAGMPLAAAENILDRTTALRLYTEGSAWFSNTGGEKGRIAVGQLADFIVPSGDYFAIDADDIKFLTSDLTVVGGRPVYGDGAFADLAPEALPVSPNWSPSKEFGGYKVEKVIQDAHAEAMHASGCAS